MKILKSISSQLLLPYCMLVAMGTFAGCGTQVGNPGDEEEKRYTKQNTGKENDKGPQTSETDPLRSPDTGAASLPSIEKCTATAVQTPIGNNASAGTITVNVDPYPSQGVTINYVGPNNTSGSSDSFEITAEGVYVVTVEVTNGASCYLSVTVDDSNLLKNIVVTVTR